MNYNIRDKGFTSFSTSSEFIKKVKLKTMVLSKCKIIQINKLIRNNDQHCVNINC